MKNNNNINTVTIFGGNSYLGSNLYNFLTNINYNVNLIQRKNVNSPFNNESITKIDYNDINAIKNSLNNCDLLIMCIGLSDTLCEENPINSIKVNIELVMTILDIAISNGIKNIFYFSSIHVYTNNLSGEISEMTPVLNYHPYAISKITVENYLRWYSKKHHLNINILRISNVYGVSFNDNLTNWNLFINNFCKQAISGVIKLKSNVMTYRNIISLVEFNNQIDFLIKKLNNSRKFRIINIGTDYNASVLDFAKLIADRCYKILKINVVINKNKLVANNSHDLNFLNFNRNVIKKMGYSTQNNILTEIDSLLTICFNKKK